MKYFTDRTPEVDITMVPQFTDEAAERIIASVKAGPGPLEAQTKAYLDDPNWRAGVMERARAAVIQAQTDL